MPSTLQKDNSEQLLRQVTKLLETDSLYSVRSFIHALYPAEIAHLLESLDRENRNKVWTLIPPSIMGEILVTLHVEVATRLIEVTDRKDLILAAESLESDDLVDLLHVLPEALLGRLESTLSCDDDTAGGLMNLDVLTIRSNVTHETVFRYLRKKGKMPPVTDSLVVVDRNGDFQGVLPLSVLLTTDPKTKVSESMDATVNGIPFQMPAADVAILFEQRDMLSAPVVSETGKLLGRITVDDIVDVIRDEADHSLMSMAGLDEEEDMFAPVINSARRRAVWLGINLFTAFLASWVIGLF